ncbi:ABC transporter permease [Segniliparus rugosus]|uniref:ABC transmembrane type-1 domain-containing protein n=1 Tax=Segniliparus rugosus (strain ATCC BAA-974 / DSM 45345 / CCUG 50838 / CIP 108380 / JCM 13579 / CDC 945) TaxID=679197 RepID=E5XMW5_SEGRC|nr:ABC transporter permease [Segniliparus rugosus]EFV14309.1 hypothetical protein HMPREF9336_00835 [Segniliparus rugosus ATCC BAA-974]
MTHYVAPEDPSAAEETGQAEQRPVGFFAEAWSGLRRSAKFWIALAALVLVFLVALAPGLFTGSDPRDCDLGQSQAPPGPGHPFGFDLQGCDVFSRTVHGAGASVAVGVGTAIGVFLIGSVAGVIAGYAGGLVDSLISRAIEIFAGIPLILAAVVLLKLMPERNVWTVVVILTAFGWPQIARIARGATVEIRSRDFVTAARALGVTHPRTVLRHIVPNVLAPVIVTTTITLGVFIVAEATLSYLGIGLPPSVVSWGGDINTSQGRLLEGSPVMFYPAAALGVTVLAFILLGDALRDALDPKARRR